MNRKTGYAALAAGIMLGAGTIGLQSCTNSGQAKEGTKASVLALNFIDSSASPATDFFQYANGKGANVSVIPASESRWGAFDELREKNRTILHDILEDAAKDANAEKGSTRQLAGDFYYSGMDSAGIEKAGIAPLKGEFDRINAIKNSDDVIHTVAHLQQNGIYTLWGVYVDQDNKNSSKYSFFAFQSGLGLPDRDYYFNKDKHYEDIRTQYLQHVANMFKLMGDNQQTADTKAKKVMEIETKLASASMTRVEQRDPYATYNPYSLADVNKLTPSLNWDNYLKLIGTPSISEVIISQPKFFQQVDNMLKTTSPEDWKTYFNWQLIHQTAPYLSSAFVTENFNFNGMVLTGVKEQQARWKRVLSTTDNAVGMALGQEYVKKTFTPEAKASAVTMVNNLMSALKDRIQNLEWMSPATKEQAMNKVNSIMVKIGYPDKWRDYKGLNIDRGPYVQNVMRADSFEFHRIVNRLGQPVDRTEWGMTPPTVNAYYNPAMNEIVFPAGILQPPFFNPEADDAVNYGGIGAVIGHELTHGFDDQGRQFDAQGNMKDWWTPEDAKNFNARASLIEQQYAAYKVPVSDKDSMSLNGKLTLGENIADLGGLTIAYAALQKALANKKVENIDGLNPDQRFFYAWAQVWRSAERPEFLAQMVTTNPHSPSRYRVNGPLSNMTEFQNAFGLKAGEAMVRPDSLRARIW